MVLKGGKVEEMGDHDTLLNNGDEYGRLYRKQLLALELEVMEE